MVSRLLDKVMHERLKNVYMLTQMTKPARSSNSVQVSFGIFWKVKINDYIHSLNINTSGKQI